MLRYRAEREDLRKHPFHGKKYPETNPVPTTTTPPGKKKNRAGTGSNVEQMPGPEPQEPELPPEPPEAEPEAEQEPEPPDRPQKQRGRPRRDQVVLPAEGSFLDDVQRIENWDDNQIWVYRVEPNTDRNAQGKAKFIKIWKERLNEEILMHIYGSGVYSLLWKRRKAPEQPLTPYRKLERLEIENYDFPPQIEPGDWLESRDNLRWTWAKKHYDAAVKKEEERKNPPPPAMTVQDTIALVEQAIDKKMQGPKDDTVLNAVRTGIEMVRSTAPQGGESSILVRLFEAASERAAKLEERVLNLLTERAKPNPAEEAPKGPLDQITQVAAVIKAVDEVRPPKGYRPADPEHPGWKILDSFVTGIAPGLNALIGVLAQKVATAGTPAPKQQPQAKQPPAAQPAPAAIPPATQPAEEKTVEPPDVLKNHFNVALEWCLQGRDPEEFADWLNAGYPTALTELRKIGSTVAPWSPEGVTPPMEAILDIAKHTPALWRMISLIPGGEEKLRTFISGVLAWTPPPEDGGNDDDDQNFQEIRNT